MEAHTMAVIVLLVHCWQLSVFSEQSVLVSVMFA